MNTVNCRPSGIIERPQASKPPVEQALITLDSTIDQLSNGLNELYARLEPVLGQLSSTKPSSPPTIIPPGSSLVIEKLSQVIQRIDLMTETLGNIRARLEL